MLGQAWIWAVVTGALIYFLLFHKSRTNRLLGKFPMVEQHVPVLGIIPFFLKCPRTGKKELVWRSNCMHYLVRVRPYRHRTDLPDCFASNFTESYKMHVIKHKNLVVLPTKVPP